MRLCILWLVRTMVLLVELYAHIRISGLQYDNLSTSEVSQGRDQYQLLHQQSTLPSYGECWKNALSALQTGCKALTEDVQHGLAFKFMNCFLEKVGRKAIECPRDESCTADMDMASLQIYNDYFIHTNNMCAFLQVQVWNEKTSSTINKLATSSNDVAQQLVESSQITSEMIRQQESSLKNQENLLKSGLQLNEAIESSSDNVLQMFTDYKQNTEQQQLMMSEVFDKISNLQNLVLGEFAGFYSLIFHAVSVLISYLLTSTPRTSSARFWLFSLMVMNIGVERLIVCWYTWSTNSGATTQTETLLYQDFWRARKVFWLAAVVVLVRCAQTYRDYNLINNDLLLEIRRQNADIKNYVRESIEEDVLMYDADISDESWCPSITDTSFTSTIVDDTFLDEEISTDEIDRVLSSTYTVSTEADKGIDDSVIEELQEESKCLYADVTYQYQRYALRQRTETPSWNPILHEETPEAFARSVCYEFHQMTRNSIRSARNFIRSDFKS